MCNFRKLKEEFSFFFLSLFLMTSDDAILSNRYLSEYVTLHLAAGLWKV